MAVPASDLRRNALGLREILFQGITHIAPALSVVFFLPVVGAKAGPAMPLSMILSLVVLLFVANTVAQFARYTPSSGGFFTFVTKGLGSRLGFMAGWSYLLYDLLAAPAVIGFLGFLTADLFKTNAGINMPWWVTAVAVSLVVWVLTYCGVSISARTTAVLGAAELIIVFALGVTMLLHPGPGSSTTAPLNPGNAPNGLSGIIAGMVFSILALTGFEAAAPLAEETRRPAEFVSRAVTASLLVVGLFYVFMTYATAIGWGTSNMPAFANNANPYYALAHRLWGGAWWILFLAIINSVLAGGISATNAVSRVVYTMGRAGVLPTELGQIHPRFRTPTRAINAVMILGIAGFLLVGLMFGADQIVGFLGTVIGFAVVVIYILANVALVRYVRREHPGDFNVLQHVAAPVLGSLLLIPPLYVSVIPVPPYPINIPPYVYVAWMVIGVGVLAWLTLRRPRTLESAPATVEAEIPMAPTATLH